MCITEAHRLVVIVVQADRCVVKELNEVLELDPEDSIHVFIHIELIFQLFFKLVRHVLPLKLPFSLRTSAIGVSNLD